MSLVKTEEEKDENDDKLAHLEIDKCCEMKGLFIRAKGVIPWRKNYREITFDEFDFGIKVCCTKSILIILLYPKDFPNQRVHLSIVNDKADVRIKLTGTDFPNSIPETMVYKYNSTYEIEFKYSEHPWFSLSVYISHLKDLVNLRFVPQKDKSFTKIFISQENLTSDGTRVKIEGRIPWKDEDPLLYNEDEKRIPVTSLCDKDMFHLQVDNFKNTTFIRWTCIEYPEREIFCTYRKIGENTSIGIIGYEFPDNITYSHTYDPVQFCTTFTSNGNRWFWLSIEYEI